MTDINTWKFLVQIFPDTDMRMAEWAARPTSKMGMADAHQPAKAAAYVSRSVAFCTLPIVLRGKASTVT